LDPKTSIIPEGYNPKFIWYGHASNYSSLEKWFPILKSRVTVVTNAQVNHPNVDSVIWKPMVTEKRIMDADIVLIPTEVGDTKASVKSPNRAVDAINAGRFVITDNRDIYGDLEDYIWIADDLEDVAKGVEFWKNNPEKVVDMISKGQEFIHGEYGNEVIIDTWLHVFELLGVINSFEEVEND